MIIEYCRSNNILNKKVCKLVLNKIYNELLYNQNVDGKYMIELYDSNSDLLQNLNTLNNKILNMIIKFYYDNGDWNNIEKYLLKLKKNEGMLSGIMPRYIMEIYENNTNMKNNICGLNFKRSFELNMLLNERQKYDELLEKYNELKLKWDCRPPTNPNDPTTGGEIFQEAFANYQNLTESSSKSKIIEWK